MEHDIRTSVTKHDELKTQIDEDVRVAQEIQDMRLELSRLRALHPPQQVRVYISSYNNGV